MNIMGTLQWAVNSSIDVDSLVSIKCTVLCLLLRNCLILLLWVFSELFSELDIRQMWQKSSAHTFHSNLPALAQHKLSFSMIKSFHGLE